MLQQGACIQGIGDMPITLPNAWKEGLLQLHCEGENLLVTAPNGFEDYTWYNEDGNEIGWAERYYTPRDTNMTYARCVMHSRTGAEIEMDIHITYYDLTSQFEYEQIKK